MFFRKLHLVLCIGISLFILHACQTPEEKLLNRLESEWTIQHSERFFRNQEGEIIRYEDLQNPGTLNIFPSPEGDPSFMLFSLHCHNYLGDEMISEGSMQVESRTQRITMYQVFCSVSMLCDIYWDVEIDQADRQVWLAKGITGISSPWNQEAPVPDDGYELFWRLTLTR